MPENNYLDQPGIFRASIADMQFSQKREKEGKTPELWITYEILAKLGEENQWESWEQYETQSIIGYHYPFCNDGSPNKTTIDQLMDALDWNGLSLAELDGRYKGLVVQITVKEETYQNQPKCKVKWMAKDGAPTGPRSLDDNALKRMCSQWDVKLRALNAKPAVTPAKKTNGKTTAKKNPKDGAGIAAAVSAAARQMPFGGQETPF